MKRQILIAATALAVCSAVPAAAQSSNEGTSGQAMGTNAMDTDAAAMPAPGAVKTAKNFVPMAAVGNTFEIESSNLALTKSTNENVKAFAKKMVDDHSDAAMKMKQAVEDTGLTVPTGLDAKHKEHLDQLSAADGSEFDRMYVTMQQAAHEEAVTLFSAYSENGEDGPIKAFASETLPTLQEHKKMIDSME